MIDNPLKRFNSYRSFILCCLLLCSPLSGWAETEYEKGWDKFQTGHYEIAHSIWLPLAEEGDGDAALGLAIIYENGLGLSRDITASVKWYQIAADNNIAEAQHDLGIKYFSGTGVERNPRKAYELWRQAAESGLSAAQTKFAFLHIQGMGTRQNIPEALKWYRQAATQGNTEAMYNLSLMYQKGTGVRKDPHQRRHWLTRASDLGYPRAQYDLGLMKLHGKDIEKSVSGGKQLLLKAAENGSVDAQYYLGTLYLNGHILRPDRELAVQLLESASRKGHKGAKQALVDIDSLDKGNSRVLGQLPKQKTDAKLKKKTAPVTRTTPKPAPKKNNTVVLNEKLATQSPPPAAPKPAPSAPPTGHDRTEWLLEQSDDIYTIQLLATTDRLGAVKSRAKYPASMDTFIYRFKRKGELWYAVGAGLHDDYKQAKNAIKQFPAKVRKNKPWVRSLKVLKPILSQSQ